MRRGAGAFCNLQCRFASQYRRRCSPAPQRALGAMQQQRNQAPDAAAVNEARLAQVSDELAKANAKIKALEEKGAPPKKR